jgi:hypothetical protein
MMRIRLFSLSLILVLAGCGFAIPFRSPVNLYPLQGPIADKKAVHVISGSEMATVFYDDYEFTFPDGETFSGPDSKIPARESGAKELASIWDSIYGPGFFVAHVLGAGYHGKAMLTGSKGTTLQVETIAEIDGPLQGIAKDSHGNVYKVTR